MNLDDAGSSSSLSPPISPQHDDTIHVARSSHPPSAAPARVWSAGDVTVTATASSNNNNNSTKATHLNNGNTSAPPNGQTPAIEKPKRQRKKKDLGPDGKPIPTDDKPKEKKPRKPREPKATTTTTTADKPPPASRKKKAVEPKREEPSSAAAEATKAPLAAAPFISPATTLMTATQPTASQPPSQRASDGLTRSSLPPPAASAPRPVSSGQHYDPIRGISTMEPSRPPSQPPTATSSAQASPHFNRASASPSIASLIDPPAVSHSAAPSTRSPQSRMRQPLFPPPSPPTATPSGPFAPPSTVTQPSLPQSAPIIQSSQPTVANDAMEIDVPAYNVTRPTPEIKAPSKSSSSAAPTPKAARPTPEPPKGTGSGLLSSADLFGGPSASEGAGRRGVNIDLDIPLTLKSGNTINIAQEIIKKYGRDAINPRAAAHREQLLRVAARANALEGGSADDMSVDLVSELDGDSNVEMGGTGGPDDDKSHTGGGNGGADDEKPRKRRKKIEDYDKDDDFIDDTELAWQENAAVAKDGFFVYSGPLIPEGSTPQIESSTNSTRGTRGRGRGRGRGGSSGAGGSTHASLAEKKSRDAPNADATSAAAASRTRGGRGRGTGGPRKPRVSKAERERIVAEKADRDRASTGSTSAAAVKKDTPPTTSASAGPRPGGPTGAASLALGSSGGGPTGAPLGLSSSASQQLSPHRAPPVLGSLA